MASWGTGKSASTEGAAAAAGAAVGATAAGPSAPRLVAAAASPTTGRRTRVLQQVADVEQTLTQLEQAAPLAVAPLALERQPATPQRQPSLQGHPMQRLWSASSTTTTTSDSSDSDSSSDSEDEGGPGAAAARLARHAAQQAALRQRLQQQASNILAAPRPSPAAATAAAPADGTATVVRVCQGKKCAAAGAAALLAHYGAMPGVVAQPSKCLKQCRRCVAVEMASQAGPTCASAALYTGVSDANAAAVLALHRQQGGARGALPAAGAARPAVP
ncbi:hypothetical protein CHLNCDRAFT_139415 [Chlorella variabilis]|uniref:Uncharacterized protein n=1 Tax=Chlorella variabilis TaxID=554065 RepID=E1ZPR4_CHLVA|nr:hypothetical protein CHLNCDRAFT_139415 [Chlorella variabilis]EFN52110.1 hypothetical protein CHLNCDRAFT_139415 [Chlorella variabilis]|eukprot:XP_005844212.1 hypothetical protein CHLNCDRAFT_139415 [Chlorella variabilis]